MPVTISKPVRWSQVKGSAALNKNLGSFLFSVMAAMVCLSMGLPRARASDESGFVGSNQCVQCHKEIAEVQLQSGHPQTLRRVRSIPQLLESVPLEFPDPRNQVLYRIERSPSQGFTLDLLATKAGKTDRMHLLWGMGAGRKGITFVGMTDAGSYGQSRVSWYQSTAGLDITTGLEDRVDSAYDALADWMSPPQPSETPAGCRPSSRFISAAPATERRPEAATCRRLSSTWSTRKCLVFRPSVWC